MNHWSPREQKMARQIGIPANASRVWWWRARNIINGDERAKLQSFVTWLEVDISRRERLRTVSNAGNK